MTAYFSIIIPTYNRSAFLKKALSSVINQSFGEFELIIVDDGSTDNTRQLINSCNDKRIKYIYQENKGASAARNRGLKEARAEWICFLDSDDWFDKEKLKITRRHIEKHPQYKIFHTEEIWYRSGVLLNQKKIHKKHGGWIFDRCLKLCCVSMSTVCVAKSVFEKSGFFDENFPCCEDYEFWLRASLQYPFYLIPQALTSKEGGHHDQVSKKYSCIDKFRIQAIEKILKAPSLSAQQRKKASEELEKKCRVLIGGCLKRFKIKEAALYLHIISNYKKLLPYS